MHGSKPHWLSAALGLVLLGGCVYPVREQTDLAVGDLVRQAVDANVEPTASAAGSVKQAGYHPTEEDAQGSSPATTNPKTAPPGRPNLLQELQYPSGLPGAKAAPIQLPPVPNEKSPDYLQQRRAREEAIERLFPALPPPMPTPALQPGPEGHPLTLADLQRIALSNSPLVRQAASDVEAGKGAVMQAGAYPNPTLGYEGDTAGTGGTAGYQGVFVEQTIRTAGKLKLAQAAAVMDLRNAELALRKAKADLVASVRGAYFGVLVADENVRVDALLTQFSDRAFRIQVAQLKAGIAAVYEPMQLRVLAFQTRAALLQAQNAYVAAWKALATTVGRPDLPPTQLAGRLDNMAVPHFAYDDVLARVLANNTDVQTAGNGIRKARYNLLAAQVSPVPDPNLHLAIQKDYTTPPNTIVTTVALGATLPVWDLNRGNIIQAQAALLRAIEEPHRVRDDLTNRVADAFNRYQSNVQTLAYYRDQILPDQVRAYQQLRVRYNVTAGDVAFGDIVTAQQTLGTLIATYLATLTAEWTAVVDLAHLLQSDELFDHLETSGAPCGPLANLEQLLSLPCAHPCNPMPTPAPIRVEPSWPAPQTGAAAPAAAATETLTLPAPRQVGEAKPAPAQLQFD